MHASPFFVTSFTIHILHQFFVAKFIKFYPLTNIMDTTYIYHDATDTLLVLIYKLGEGNNEIWFALEYRGFFQQIKTKKQTITMKALKIFIDRDKEYAQREIDVATKLTVNRQPHKNINYPLGNIDIQDAHGRKMTIVIYDVMVGSIHDVMKVLHEIPNDSIHKMIAQMVDGINFIHRCGYIHTDIKVDNVLIAGNTCMQEEIVKYAIAYNVISKIPKTLTKKNMGDVLPKIIDKFADCITEKFDLYDLINQFSEDESEGSYDENETTESSGEYSTDSETDDEDDDVGDEDENDAKTNSYRSSLQSLQTETTYHSSKGRYVENYCMFHEEYVKKKLDEMENKTKAVKPVATTKSVGVSLPSASNNSNHGNRGFVTLSKEQQRLLEILKNPIVKITDFDLLMHMSEEKHTRQMRFFRSPEIVLGLDYDKGIDYWAFGHLVMEMVTDSWLIDVEMDSKYKMLDNDLITVKLFFEKMCCNQRDTNDLMDLVLSSKRKNYLVDEERGILKFVDEIRCVSWTNKVSDAKIRDLLHGLFKINHVERVMEWKA